jgi:hypothetical protein
VATLHSLAKLDGPNAMIGNLVLLALPLVATYLVVTIWHRRFRQFANFPQPKPSFLWGNLQTVHEYTLRGPPKLHHGMLAEAGCRLQN